MLAVPNRWLMWRGLDIADFGYAIRILLASDYRKSVAKDDQVSSTGIAKCIAQTSPAAI